MNASVLEAWVSAALKESARFPVLFINLGSAFPKARMAIAESAGVKITLEEYLEKGPLSDCLVLMDGVERLSARRSETMGLLRSKVFDDIDRGVRFILLSTLPRHGYPAVAGSSLFVDAKAVKPPNYSLQSVPARFGCELDPDQMQFEVLLTRAFSELGGVVLAEVSQITFGVGLDSASILQEMSPVAVDAAVEAGLVVQNEKSFVWASGITASLLREAISAALGRMVEPPLAVSDIAMACWEVERRVRRSMRNVARAKWRKDWPRELAFLSDNDAAVPRLVHPPGKASVELEDPLVLLSLKSLFTLRKEAAFGDLGMSEQAWTSLANELLPIHERLRAGAMPLATDAVVAQRWRAVVAEQLSEVGAPSVASTIQRAPAPRQELLKNIRLALQENPHFKGSVSKDYFALVKLTLDFIALTLDIPESYLREFAPGHAPREKEVQKHFHQFLASSDLTAGRTTMENENIAFGRSDVVVYLDSGVRLVTEVKRADQPFTRESLEAAFLQQALAYQSSNVPFAQLLLLDLRPDRPAEEEQIAQSMWVVHSRDEDDVIKASTTFAIVRGNRKTPSSR